MISFFPMLLANCLISLQGCLVTRMESTSQYFLLFFFFLILVLMRIMIFQILKTIAAPWISAVLCHSLDPTPTWGLVSMEAMLVIKDIFFYRQTCQFSRLWLELYSFKPYLELLCSIFFDLLPEGFMLQTKVMMFACFTSQLLCEQQTRDEKLTPQFFPSHSSITSPWTWTKHAFISLLLLSAHFSKHEYL